MKKIFFLILIVFISFFIIGCDPNDPFNDKANLATAYIGGAENILELLNKNNYLDKISNVSKNNFGSLKFSLKNEIQFSYKVENNTLLLTIIAPNKKEYLNDIAVLSTIHYGLGNLENAKKIINDNININGTVNFIGKDSTLTINNKNIIINVDQNVSEALNLIKNKGE